MRIIHKSTKLENVCYDVRGPVLDEANLMRARGIDVMPLNIGNPAVFGFHAPEALQKTMSDALSRSDGYSDSKGLLAARQAIAAYCAKKGIQGVTPDDIYTGNGVSDLIMMSMQGLLDNGDEMLVPMPDYPLWTGAVTLAGGRAVHYRCDEKSDWYPDLADMERKITDKTKGIIIINPNNPTGALYPVEILQQIVEIARRHQLIIFSDEIYDRLVMDGLEHTSIASLADDLFVITLNGLSKSHRAAGYRVGWMTLSGDKRGVRDYIAGLNLLSNMRLCSNVPAQTIIPGALGSDEPDLDILPGGRIYEQRELITNTLNDIPGLSAVKPKAAFYIFPKLDIQRFHITDDEQFVLDFLRAHHIMLVHGKGFNWDAPDHFRIVYLPCAQDLTMATDKLRDFLATYQQA